MVITRYNETNADHRAVALTNSIGTVSPTFVGVGFSHPSGVFKINDFVNFTHFTAEFGGVTYIYKVTGFHAVNSTVRMVSYTLDYMKDWFSKNNWSDLKGAVVAKSNVLADRSKLLVDSEFLTDGSYTQNWEQLTSQSWASNWDYTNGYYIVVVKFPFNTSSHCQYVACAMTVDNFVKFSRGLLSTEGSAMMKQIKTCYFCPFFAKTGALSAANAGTIKYMKTTIDEDASDWWRQVVEAETSPSDFLDPEGNAIPCYYIYPTNPSTREYYASFGLTYIPVNDFIDLDCTQRKLYIPYFGTVEVPARELCMTNSLGNTVIDISFDYILNPFDGTVAVRWFKGNSHTSIILGEEALPIIDLPLSDVSIAVTNATQNFQVQKQSLRNGLLGAGMSMLGSGFSLASGIKSGQFSLNNAIAGGEASDIVDAQQRNAVSGLNMAGGVIGGALGLANAFNAVDIAHANFNNTLQAIARSGMGTTSMSGGGYLGWVLNMPILETIKINNITYADRCEYAGYPCNKMATNVTPTTNARYMIDTQYLKVNGLDWYSNGVKNDIAGEYIYYNK